MVCYFFETIQEICLAPKDNVSLSLGFDSFINKINCGFDDDWRLQAESVVDLLEKDVNADDVAMNY